MISLERRQRYDRGLRAEMIAALYLTLKGYRILARRMKTPVGEIDLIARRGRTVVFIEVKARQTLDMGVESIQPRQSQRIVRGAEYYMATYRGPSPDIRFDVIAISKPLRIRHIKSAFSKG